MSEKIRKTSPIVLAGFVSRLFFWWMTKIFREGRKRPLGLNDLYDVLNEDKSEYLANELLLAWNLEEQNEKAPRLLNVLIRLYGKKYLLMGVFVAVEELVLQIARPLCLGLLIKYFSINDKSQFFEGYDILIICGVIGGALIYPILHHTYFYQTQRLGMQIRIAISALIYRKATKLSRKQLRDITNGKILNLLSNDTSRFDSVLGHIHFIWIAPLQLGIALYFIWGYFQSWSIIGIVLLVLLAPLQGLMGKLFGKIRYQTSILTDFRMKLLDEVISGIKIIKLYTMEYLYQDRVKGARKNECKQIMNTAYLRIINATLHFLSAKLIVSSTLVAYALTGNQLTSESVFVTIALYNSVKTVFTFFAPLGISQISETLISIKRIEEFLNSTLVVEESTRNVELNTLPNSVVALKIDSLCGSWEKRNPTLIEINLEIASGNLVGIIGRTGAGKTSLLLAILKELPITKGRILTNGSISYASQEPWIFEGTVRENIVFGRSYDKIWYDSVINTCALKDDLAGFPHGDETFVGDKGSCLSGGQMARVNLARAVYAKADIVLLDDPLCAVDANVANHIFSKCFKGILKDSTVLLVTHQTQFLSEVNQIIILDQGKLNYVGSYQSVQNDLLITNINTNINQTKSTIDKPSVPSNFEYIEDEDDEIDDIKDADKAPNTMTLETTSKIRSSGKLFWKYFSSGAGSIGILALCLSNLLAQGIYTGSDYWLQLWVQAEERVVTEEFEKTRNSTFSESMKLEDRSFYLIGYGIFLISLLIFSLLRAIIFFILAFKSSIELHARLTWSILRAKMQFFEESSVGKILNVFSKDVGIIDDLLPITMYEALEAALNVIGIMVIVSIVNPVLIGPSAVVLVLLVSIRNIYLLTARRIKLLEGMTKGPVFSHVTSTLNGITTIRAHKLEKNVINQFDSYQDTHTSAWFLVLSGTRWLAFVIELVSILFITSVTISFVIFSSDGSYVGLAISSAMNLTGMFQWGVRQSAETENLLISVERISRFTKVIQEPALYGIQPPKKKELKGSIFFRNVFIIYGDKTALHDISLNITGGERIGIVGRTGSGKTTLISSLFQLINPVNGTIEIDGENICNLGLHDLRSKISIIPQEPVLFNGTIRNNLQPFTQVDDDCLWEALRKVNLDHTIKMLQNGLDFEVKDKGSNFSVGEKQLLCLCRAILQDNSILVLDEATASLDKETDSFIQKTLKVEFKSSTVLIVAHRLETVIHCDKILVLDSGRIMEFDSPLTLISNTNSFFYKMIEEMGTTESENLRLNITNNSSPMN